MKKGQIIGLAVTGLAVVGGLAIFNWVKKPKATRGKFLSMDGNNFFSVEKSDFSNVNGKGSHFYTRRAKCKRPDGTTYVTMEGQDYCTYGRDKVVAYIDK